MTDAPRTGSHAEGDSPAAKPQRIPRSAKYLPAGLKRLLPTGFKGLPVGVVDPPESGGRRPLTYDGRLPLAGWFLLDESQPPTRGRASIEGETCLDFDFPVERPDVLRLFGAPERVVRIGFEIRVPVGERRGPARLKLEAWNDAGTRHALELDVDLFEPSAAEALAGQLGDLIRWQRSSRETSELVALLPIAKLELPAQLKARHDDRIEVVGWCLRDLSAAERIVADDAAPTTSATDRAVSSLDVVLRGGAAKQSAAANPLEALLGAGRGRVRLLDPDGKELGATDLEEERGWMGAGRADLARVFSRVPGAARAGFRGDVPTNGYRGPARLELALPVPGSEHLFIEQDVVVRAWEHAEDERRRRAALDALEDTAALAPLLPLGELDAEDELLVRHDDTVELTGWCLLPGGVAPERLAVTIGGQRVGTLVGGSPREDLRGISGLGDLWRVAGFTGRVPCGGQRGRFTLSVEAEDPALADPSLWRHDFGPQGPPAPWTAELTVSLKDDSAATWNRQRVREFDAHAPTPGKQLIAHYPLQLFIEFTTACQLSCLMCRHGGKVKDVPLNQYLGDEHVRALVEVLPHLKTLNMFGWGEATLHPRYCEFLRDARILNPALEIAVTSHFNVVTDELIQTLVQASITSITISVDGASKEVYEFIRRRAHFEAVCANIRRLVAAKETAGVQLPHIVCEFVVQRANIAELVDYVELVADLGVDDIILEPVASKTELVPDYGGHLEVYAAAKARAAELGVNLRGLGCERFEAFTPDWQEADFRLSSYSDSSMVALTLDSLSESDTAEEPQPRSASFVAFETAVEAMRALEEAGAVSGEAAEFIPPPESDLEPLVDYEALSSGTAVPQAAAIPVVLADTDSFQPLPPPPKGASDDLVCYEPFQTAYINADGTITPCCWSSRVLGRLSEASPEAIWLGDAAAALRREVLANDLDPICKRCVAMGRARGRIDT